MQSMPKKWINFTQNDRHFSGVVKVFGTHLLLCLVEEKWLCYTWKEWGVNSAAKCFPIKKVLIKGSILILAKFALFMERKSFVSGSLLFVFFSVLFFLNVEDYSLTYTTYNYMRACLLLLLWIGFKCDMWQWI